MTNDLVPTAHITAVLPSLAEGDRPEVLLSVAQATADHLAQWEGDQQFRALHEAAHAVVAVVLGLRVRSVDVKSRWQPATTLTLGDDDQPEVVRASTDMARIVTFLAGPAVERLILGEPTTGGSRDLLDATYAAIQRFEQGLDPDATYVSCEAFNRPPDSISEARAASAVRTLAEARSRADALVAEHREAIVGFARRLLVARTLSGGDLATALREVGLEPAPQRR